MGYCVNSHFCSRIPAPGNWPIGRCIRSHYRYNAAPTPRHTDNNKTMTTTLQALQDWVDQVAKLTQPDAIHWCTGTDSEDERLVAEMLASGTLSELDQDGYPNCYLHLSDPNDVARVEHLTFVCCRNEVDAGPNNLWVFSAVPGERNCLGDMDSDTSRQQENPADYRASESDEKSMSR